MVRWCGNDDLIKHRFIVLVLLCTRYRISAPSPWHCHIIVSSSSHQFVFAPSTQTSTLRWFDSELHSTIQIQYSNPIFNLAPHMRLWAPKECQILNAILLFQLKFRLVYNNARKKDVFSSFRVNIFPYGTRVIFKLSNFFFWCSTASL